jgi:hypothetical protein
VIDDLVLEDADQPRLFGRGSGERLAGGQRRQQRFLHQVFGCLGRADAKQRVAIQRVAVVAQPIGRG